MLHPYNPLHQTRIIHPTRKQHEDHWVSPWHEFGRMHHISHLSHMDQTRRDIDRQFMQMERAMSTAFKDIGFPRWHSILDDAESETPEIVREGDHKKYRLNLHMGEDFEPEDIRVKLKHHQMTVEAKSEHKSQDGHSRVYHEVSKKFTLPDSIDTRDVKSILEPDGCLMIEAPMPATAIEERKKPKEIPVFHDSV